MTACKTGVTYPTVPAQQATYGPSGHGGCSLDFSFVQWHELAITQAFTQAICQYRHGQRITGPLFLGFDTHALSQPTCSSALEVLAANGADVMLTMNNKYPRTPAVVHAILKEAQAIVDKAMGWP